MKGIRSLFIGTVLIAGTAMGQMGGLGMQMPTLRYNPALLMDPNVAKDMHLSPEVSQKVQSAMMQAAMSAQKSAGSKGMMGMLGMMDQMQKAVLPLLNPAQKVRLHQITLQATGVKALADKQVGTEVGLSPAQQAKISSKLAEISMASIKDMHLTGDPTQALSHMKEIGAVQKKINAQSVAAVNSMLTPKQKAAWIRIQGRPIKLSPLFSALTGG